VGRGRRSNESSLVRSPDEADASIGNGLEQRERDKNRGSRRIGIRESRSDIREKIPGLVLALLEKFSQLPPLPPDTRGLNKRTDVAMLGASRASEVVGIFASAGEQRARRKILAVRLGSGQRGATSRTETDEIEVNDNG
jgi:hypothetical protein